MELDGKTALVTGAGSGIGKAIATAFANEGTNVLVNDLTEAGRAVAEEIDGTFLQADLSERTAVVDLAKHALEACGRIDILVNNAGFQYVAPVEEFPEDTWVKMIQVMLIAAFQLTKHLAPAMKQNKWGRIINITSIAVKQPVDSLILSNSVRAAVTGFARTLANEVGAFGITVNNVMPGYTRTERLEELANRMAETKGITVAEVTGAWEGEIPMGRLAEPRELGALVAFLASERAGYITGTSIPVDGGWIRALL